MDKHMTRGYRKLISEANSVIVTIPASEALGMFNDPDVIFVDIRDLPELERDGKIAKYVSPEGTEFWYSPKSQSFCGTCGQLALPGVHPDPACNRHQPAPGGTPTATTGMTEVNPDQAATLIHYAVQAADGEAQLNPPPDGETPGDYTRRLVTAAVLHLVEQGLLVIPTDLERRIAEPIPADRQVARRMQLSGSDRDNPRPTTSSGTRGARPAPFRSAAS